MEWLFLSGAIFFEVIGTTCMKLSQGLTRLIPSIVMGLSYALCFLFLTLSLKKLPVSVAYAIWSAVGTAIIAAIGVLYFKEPLTGVKVASLILIIAGVCGLQLSLK